MLAWIFLLILLGGKVKIRASAKLKILAFDVKDIVFTRGNKREIDRVKSSGIQ